MESTLVSPPLGGTRALLLSHVPALVPSERRVVQLFIDEPERVATLSVADIARRTETSPATVVRASQRVGLGGFQRLKEHLLRDLGAHQVAQQSAQQVAAAHSFSEGSRVAPVSGQRPEGGGVHPVERVFQRAGEGVLGALGSLDLTAFDEACATIRAGNRLLLVGNGASLPPAQMAALHFLSAGRVCEAPTDIVTQHISAKLLRPGDVCLAVSDSGMNQFTLRAARLAAEGGATVIAVTSYAKSDLASVAAHALVVGAEFHLWNDDALGGNIAQMLLLSALLRGAIGESGAASVHTDVVDEARAIMGQAPPQ